MRTCQMLGVNGGFQSVTGATSFMGSRPTPSALTTIAGRVLRISAPIVGSKFTSQISPRCGLGEIDKVSSLPLFAFAHLVIGLVIAHHPSRLLCHFPATFLNGQPQETPPLFEG